MFSSLLHMYMGFELKIFFVHFDSFRREIGFTRGRTCIFQLVAKVKMLHDLVITHWSKWLLGTNCDLFSGSLIVTEIKEERRRKIRRKRSIRKKLKIGRRRREGKMVGVEVAIDIHLHHTLITNQTMQFSAK